MRYRLHWACPQGHYSMLESLNLLFSAALHMRVQFAYVTGDLRMIMNTIEWLRETLRIWCQVDSLSVATNVCVLNACTSMFCRNPVRSLSYSASSVIFSPTWLLLYAVANRVIVMQHDASIASVMQCGHIVLPGGGIIFAYWCLTCTCKAALSPIFWRSLCLYVCIPLLQT